MPKMGNRSVWLTAAALVSLGLSGTGGKTDARLAPSFRCAPAARAASSGLIVVVRGTAPERAGDLWLVSTAGAHERHLTTGAMLFGLAADTGCIACVGDAKGRNASNLYVLSRPEWRLQQITSEGDYSDAPAWRAGTGHVLIARVSDDPSADRGLYEVNVRQRTKRRLLGPVHTDLSVAGMICPSSRAHYVAAGTVITGYLGFSLLNLRTGKRIVPRGLKGLSGGRRLTWLDDENLLIAGTPNTPEGDRVIGGILRLNLRTRRLTRWLYPASSEVEQLCRSPRGDLFAAGLDEIDTPSVLPRMAARIDLVIRRPRGHYTLPLPGPAHLCGFSPDGSQLLVLVLSRAQPPSQENPYRGMKSDAYLFDLKTQTCRRLARDVSDATWVGGT